jgi:hypothetical protein
MSKSEKREKRLQQVTTRNYDVYFKKLPENKPSDPFRTFIYVHFEKEVAGGGTRVRGGECFCIFKVEVITSTLKMETAHFSETLASTDRPVHTAT